MRLTDLVGHEVVDESGQRLGRCHDVRMRRDGPVLQPSGEPAFRILGLVVGNGGIGLRLGYGVRGVEGPWLLKVVFSRRARRSRYVDWSWVADMRAGQIVVRGPTGELPSVPTQDEQAL